MNSQRIADRIASARALALVALLGAAAVGACADALLVTPAPAPSQLRVAYTVTADAAGMASLAGAFDRADRLRVQLTRTAGTSLDTTLSFTPSATTIVPLSITVTEEQENATLAFELRRGTDPLFRGTSDIILRRGDTTDVDLQLSPVPAGVRLPASVPTFTAIGDAVQLQGAVIFATGDTITTLSPTGWSSTNMAVASVSPTGLVLALAEGQTEIRATYGTFTASVSVQVAAVVTQVTVQASSPNVQTNQDINVNATAVDRRGNTLARTFTWLSSNPGTASVTPSGAQSAVVRGLVPGPTRITATTDGVSGFVDITVIPPPVVSVTVAPSLDTLRVGQTVQLTATPRDAGGQPLSGRVVTWGSSNNSIASVSATGVVTAIGPGQAIITATSEGRSGTATIVVIDVVTAVRVTPNLLTMAIGDVQTLTGTALNAAGVPLSGHTFTWQSDNSSVVRVTPTGAQTADVTAVGPGQATITAAAAGHQATATIVVRAPSPILFQDGFEGAVAWTATGLWNETTGANIRNTAVPTYVSLAPGDGSGGALPAAPEGSRYAWFGNPSTGNFMGQQAPQDFPGSGGESVAPASGDLLSPPIAIPAGVNTVYISLTSWFEIESIDPHDHDVMDVLLVDATTLAPIAMARMNPSTPFSQAAPMVPGTSAGENQPPIFERITLQATGIAGRTVRLQFTFDSVDELYNGFRGWIVDDVTISSQPISGGGMQFAPRPSTAFRLCAATCVSPPARRSR